MLALGWLGAVVCCPGYGAGSVVTAVIGFLMVVSGAAGLVWRTDASSLSGDRENAGT